MSNLDLKLAKFVPPKGRGILVYLKGPMSPAMKETLEQFRSTNPRENIFFLQPGTAGELPTDGGYVEQPLRWPKYTRRFFRRLRLQMLLVDEGAQPPGHFVRAALAHHSAVGFFDSARDLSAGLRKHSQRESAGKLYAGLAEQGVAKTRECLALEVAREPEEYSNLKKRLRLFVWTHIKSRLRASRLRKRQSFAEVNETLQSPCSILCLGNGPSSEDGKVDQGRYDSVFRVNHRWLERGRFTTPDAVFTGALDSVEKTCRDILYVFITPERANRIVMKASKIVPRLSFANADELGFPLSQFEPYQPTNGVIMLYFAVMLQPEELTIAGIDLYRDPRGCYPDSTDMPNVYTSAHSEQKELQMILSILGQYKGNLTIIGDSLQQEYENSLSENRLHTA